MKRIAVPLALMASASASLFLGFTLLRSIAVGFFLYYVLCCVVLPLMDYLALRKLPVRRIPSLLGFARPERRDLALGFGSGAAMVAAMAAALVLLRGPLFGDGRILEALKLWGVSKEKLGFVYAVMLAFNGFAEECFWRGYLHEKLGSLRNRFAAIALPSFFFGAQHVFVVSSIVADPAIIALFLVGILGAGAIWGFMRERSGALLPSVVSHMMVTTGYMGIFFFFTVRG